jgi:hypothetical protein
MATRLSALGAVRLYPQETSWYSLLLRGTVDPRAIVRLEGLGKLKKKKNPPHPGIGRAALRLVA